MKPSALWALFSVLLDVNHISWSVFRMITPSPLGLISSSWVNYFSFVCPELLKQCSAAVPRSSRGLCRFAEKHNTQSSIYKDWHASVQAFIYCGDKFSSLLHSSEFMYLCIYLFHTYNARQETYKLHKARLLTYKNWSKIWNGITLTKCFSRLFQSVFDSVCG